MPQPVRKADRFKLRNHRLSSFKGNRYTQGICPIVSWKSPGPRSFSQVVANPEVVLLVTYLTATCHLDASNRGGM